MISGKIKASIAFWLIVAAGWLYWQKSDTTSIEPIVVADGAVIVRNQTAEDWQSVRIWVNDHYSGGANRIPAGGFVREPLSRFVAAQGQTINAASTRITSVVVLASHPDGTRVRMAWGKPFLH